jgi:hypothetical protein
MHYLKHDHRLPLALAVVAVWVTSSGCVTLRNCQSWCANKWTAHSAYKDCACPPECISSERDYRKGWKDGYYEVATGGEGCLPPLPPECYWTPRYECDQGRAAIQTWYRGYQDGAHAAISHGVQQYNFLPSPHAAGAPHASYDDPAEHYDHATESVPMPETQADELPTPEESASRMPAGFVPPAMQVTGAATPVPSVAVPLPPVSRPMAIAPVPNPLRPARPSLADTAADLR